ncbi:MAG: hypothetical protein ACP5QP_07535 [Brevinematia bacterium]
MEPILHLLLERFYFPFRRYAKKVAITDNTDILAILAQKEIVKRFHLLNSEERIILFFFLKKLLKKVKKHPKSAFSLLIRDFITDFLAREINSLSGKDLYKIRRYIFDRIRQRKLSTKEISVLDSEKKVKEWFILTFYQTLLIFQKVTEKSWEELIESGFLYFFPKCVLEIQEKIEDLSSIHSSLNSEDNLTTISPNDPSVIHKLLELYHIIREKEDKFYKKAKEAITIISQKQWDLIKKIIEILKTRGELTKGETEKLKTMSISELQEYLLSLTKNLTENLTKNSSETEQNTK